VCYFEAARLGNRDAAVLYAQMSRQSSTKNQERGLALLQAIPEPTPAESYQLGLVQNWLGELEASAKTHLLAAERGSTDAQFELYVFFAQGLGVEASSAQSDAWLKRAAEGNHPRALYNVTAAYASGSEGEPDKKMVAALYERAAEHGSGRAAATLAVMILTSELEGTTEKAVEWLNRADETGFEASQLLDAVGIDDPRDEGVVDADESEEEDDDDGGVPW
jgi:TPR repeat protein